MKTRLGLLLILIICLGTFYSPISADTATVDPAWTDHTQVHPYTNGEPAVGSSQGGTPFYVWEENGYLYWRKNVEGIWSPRAYLAGGSQPTVVGTSQGRVHCLFSNEIAGYMNIYHVEYAWGQWSLPRRVSVPFDGVSTNPKASASGNEVFVVWEHLPNDPSTDRIYWGVWDGRSWNTGWVLPSEDASKPDVAYRNGSAYIAWQQYGWPNYKSEIWFSRLTDYSWSTAENVSWPLTDSNNTDVSLVIDKNGKTHIVWAEHHPVGGDGYYIQYTAGVVDDWSPPRVLTWYGDHGIKPVVQIAGANHDWVLAAWAHKDSAYANPSFIAARKKPITAPYWQWESIEQATPQNSLVTAPDLVGEPKGKAYLIYNQGSAAYAAQRSKTYPVIQR